MTKRRPLEEPTTKMSREVLLRAAREADARARAAEEAAKPSPPAKNRPKARSEVELVVDVDDQDHPTDPSELHPTDGAGAPLTLSCVPRVVVSDHDLVLFGLDDGSMRLLSAIDGVTTIEGIVGRVRLRRGRVLELLAALASRGVVEFAETPEP